MRHTEMKLNLAPNPVFVKELRGQMRGPRAYLFLTGILVLLGLVSYGFYQLALVTTQNAFGSSLSGAVIGQTTFMGLMFLSLVVICVLAPALTASAISGEHERKTMDLLLATPLSPFAILFGKLASALSYILLILVAAVPLVSLAFVFGGVTALDLVGALVTLFCFAVAFCVMGLFFSALIRRSAAGLILSYVVLCLFVFGTLFVYIVVGVVNQRQPPNWILAPNPFSALASVLVHLSMPSLFDQPAALNSGVPSNGLTPLLWLLAGGSMDSQIPSTVPLWYYTASLYGWLTVVLYFLSSQLLKPVRRFRLGRKRWALAGILCLGPLLAAPIAFGPFTPERIFNWLRLGAPCPCDLIANGKFTAPLEPAWKIDRQSEGTDAAAGFVEVTNLDNRSVLRLSHTGAPPVHSTLSVTQALNQAVPRNGSLRARVVLHVMQHEPGICGEQGKECALTLKLTFDDAAGGKHEWAQGFYVPGKLDANLPRTCGGCESRRTFVQVPFDQWYTYESPNLLQETTGVPGRDLYLLRSISLSAAGSTFETHVAEVALNVRADWPPDGGPGFDVPPTPTPVLVVPAPMMPPRRIVVPVVPVTREPTPTPESPLRSSHVYLLPL